MRVARVALLGIGRSERGVAGAIVALMLTVVLGLAAVVVDVGNSWQTRRHLVTATDAAALAAAQAYVQDSTGCDAVAADYINKNFGAATMTACTYVAPSATAPGRVTVEAETLVDFNFAPALGIDDTTVTSSTTVRFDRASSVSGGLRPFGLCNAVLDTFTPTIVPDNGVIYRVYYGKDQHPDSCGGNNVGGNWGILDFDGGSNPQGDIRDWTEFGYPGTVNIGDIIDGNPGAYSNSLNGALTELLNVDYFTLPIFDTANGNGSNAEFHIVNFAVVKLHGFKLTGAEKNRYFEIEFLDRVVQGTGGHDQISYGPWVIDVCAVDGTPISPCNS